LLSTNYKATEFYHYLLTKSSIGKIAMDYLLTRGINKKIIETFHLGYSPSSWNSLTRFLQSKLYTPNEIVDAGLAIRSESGRIYDRFRARLMFPLKDQKGNTLGFSGRILKESKDAKYVNTPETLLYHKRNMLFGLHLTKEIVRKENAIILVEGEFDMITPFQYGIGNIAAVKGTAVTVEQLQLIKRYTNRILLALDADNAGEEAIKRTIEVAEPLGLEINVVLMKEGKDPDAAIRSNENLFKQSIKKPIPVYDFLISLFMRPFGKKKIGESIAPYIYSIQNPIVQTYYIKQLSKLLDVSEESIYRVIQTGSKKRKSTAFKKASQPSVISRSTLLQRYLIETLLHNGKRRQIIEAIQPCLNPTDFSIPSLRVIYSALISFLPKQSEFDINSFALTLPEELRSVVDELYLHASADTISTPFSIQNCVKEIKRNAVKEQMKIILAQGENNKPKQEDELKKLHVRLKEVTV